MSHSLHHPPLGIGPKETGVESRLPSSVRIIPMEFPKSDILKLIYQKKWNFLHVDRWGLGVGTGTIGKQYPIRSIRSSYESQQLKRRIFLSVTQFLLFFPLRHPGLIPSIRRDNQTCLVLVALNLVKKILTQFKNLFNMTEEKKQCDWRSKKIICCFECARFTIQNCALQYQ